MSKRKTTPARAKRASRKQPAADWDLAAEQRRCERAAKSILAFVEDADVPEFIYHAVLSAVTEAGRKVGFRTPEYTEPRRELVKMLAELVAATTGGPFTLRRAPAEAFAHHLAEALRVAKSDPDLIPVGVYNEIADASNDLLNAGLDYDSEEVFRLALEGHARRREAESDREHFAEVARRLLEGEGGDS